MLQSQTRQHSNKQSFRTLTKNKIRLNYLKPANPVKIMSIPDLAEKNNKFPKQLSSSNQSICRTCYKDNTEYSNTRYLIKNEFCSCSANNSLDDTTGSSDSGGTFNSFKNTTFYHSLQRSNPRSNSSSNQPLRESLNPRLNTRPKSGSSQPNCKLDYPAYRGMYKYQPCASNELEIHPRDVVVVPTTQIYRNNRWYGINTRTKMKGFFPPEIVYKTDTIQSSCDTFSL